MIKKVIVAAGGILLLAVAFLPFKAGAANDCNTIQNGLWSGVNAALGTNYGCSTVAQPTTPSQPPATQSGLYIALGDSVAAGLGLPVASAADQACGVSAQAYPTAVAGVTRQSYINAACSGATSGDIVTSQRTAGGQTIAPQIDLAFANGVPSLVSITAGANDTYWQYFAQKCYTGTCGTTADEVAIRALISTMKVKYSFALSQIENRSNGQPPRVVLTGYYAPLSTLCEQQLPGVTATEISWLNQKTDEINAAIAQTAAQYPFARYAPVSFSGHELCTTDSWIQGLSEPAPLHPTARGQQAIAVSVVAAAQ